MTNYGSDNVSAYAIAASGALTPVTGSPFAAGTKPYNVAIDPKGNFAYVTNFGSNNVSAYTINTSSGALTPVAGSPFVTGTEPIECGRRTERQVRVCDQLRLQQHFRLHH